MTDITTLLKDYPLLITAIVSAIFSAIFSIISIFINTSLSSKKDKANKVFDKELERIFNLEEEIGILVDDLLFYHFRNNGDNEYLQKKQHYLKKAMGQFRRYPDLHEALRKLSIDSGWFYTKDMNFGSDAESQKAKDNLENSYKDVISACDLILGRNITHWWFKP